MGNLISKGKGSDLLDGLLDTLDQMFIRNVGMAGSKMAPSSNAQDGHTEMERLQVQHLHEGSLGGTDLLTILDDTNVRDNFNGSLDDLGGNAEGLEEGSLVRVHTSATGRDENVS